MRIFELPTRQELNDQDISVAAYKAKTSTGKIITELRAKLEMAILRACYLLNYFETLCLAEPFALSYWSKI
jgi:hypothetical protein